MYHSDWLGGLSRRGYQGGRSNVGRICVFVRSDMQSRKCQNGQLIALPLKFQRALALLLRANEYAEQTSGSVWEFAVEIQHLREVGLLENDLRFLVRLNYVVHSREVTMAGRNGRQFKPTGDLYFTAGTCFVLTPEGVAAANECCSAVPNIYNIPIASLPFSLNSDENSMPHVPAWDQIGRALYFEGQTVKRFKCRAANQETVLSAFQEEGWPLRIDDPLAPRPSIDIKQRLSDTIKCLNRKQMNNLVHFRGDGSGEGVVWESVISHGFSGSLS